MQNFPKFAGENEADLVYVDVDRIRELYKIITQEGYEDSAGRQRWYRGQWKFLYINETGYSSWPIFDGSILEEGPSVTVGVKEGSPIIAGLSAGEISAIVNLFDGFNFDGFNGVIPVTNCSEYGGGFELYRSLCKAISWRGGNETPSIENLLRYAHLPAVKRQAVRELIEDWSLSLPQALAWVEGHTRAVEAFAKAYQERLDKLIRKSLPTEQVMEIDGKYFTLRQHEREYRDATGTIMLLGYARVTNRDERGLPSSLELVCYTRTEYYARGGEYYYNEGPKVSYNKALAEFERLCERDQSEGVI